VSHEDAFQAAAGDVLTKMDRLIAEIKHQRLDQTGAAQLQQAQKTAHDANTLVSVLEEQFRAMETWLIPMTHGDKAEKARVIDQLMERFGLMVRGYNRLIEILQSRKAEKEPPTRTPEAPAPGPQAGESTPKPKRRMPPSAENS
jgi:hypothetical protein